MTTSCSFIISRCAASAAYIQPTNHRPTSTAGLGWQRYNFKKNRVTSVTFAKKDNFGNEHVKPKVQKTCDTEGWQTTHSQRLQCLSCNSVITHNWTLPAPRTFNIDRSKNKRKKTLSIQQFMLWRVHLSVLWTRNVKFNLYCASSVAWHDNYRNTLCPPFIHANQSRPYENAKITSTFLQVHSVQT